jgi:AraC-like DNA-binding protein
MHLIPDITLFLLLFSIGILGMTVSGILFFMNNDSTLASKLLAAILASMSMMVITNATYLTDFFPDHPYAWRAMSFVSFCIGPFSYLYVRSVLERSFRLRQIDLLFFVPAFLYELNRLPYYTLSIQDKIAVVSRALRDQRLIALEPEGFLPPGWMAFFRLLTGLGFLFAQVYLVFFWSRELRHSDELESANSSILKWLRNFTILLGLAYIFVFLITVVHVAGKHNMGMFIVASIAFSILYISFSLLTRPRILYGLRGWVREEQKSVSLQQPVAEVVEKGKRKYTLDAQQGEEYKQLVESHFSRNKPYLKSGYSLRDLSKEIDVPAYLISVLINQAYGKNFNELVNYHRVGHLVQLIEQKDPKLYTYTTEAIGHHVGFNSRTTFIAAVKKRTGRTPSELLSVSGMDKPNFFPPVNAGREGVIVLDTSKGIRVEDGAGQNL